MDIIRIFYVPFFTYYDNFPCKDHLMFALHNAISYIIDDVVEVTYCPSRYFDTHAPVFQIRSQAEGLVNDIFSYPKDDCMNIMVREKSVQKLVYEKNGFG